jgi:hypothetical protein
MAETGQADQRESTIWTRWFIEIFVVVAIAGCVLLFLGISGISVSTLVALDFTSGNRATLVAYVGLVVICLAALWFTRDRFLQAGLVLQVGAVICGIAGVVLSLRSVPILATPPLASAISALAVASAVLNLPSLIYLSHGIAEWQQSERKYLLLQIALTLVLGSLMLLGLDAQRVVYPPEYLITFCNVAAVMVMLARPACWKAQPLITIFLSVGRLVSLSYSAFIFRQLLFLPAVLRFQILYGLNVGATVVFILGVLLLAQTARVQTVALDQVESPVAG